MNIATILGTRPEIIRLSLIIPKLDRLAQKHILVHTGQNFTASLSDIFFEELGIRHPDYLIESHQSALGGQLSIMFGEVDRILRFEKIDLVLLLGDTNSALSAIIAERMGIPVIHMEAGNRCFDLSVPEEKNRKVIDAISTINMPYTEYSKANLLREGFPSNRIVVTGNPIYEVLEHFKEQIDGSDVLERLGLQEGQYLLVTAHRAENVDHPQHLSGIIEGINLSAEELGLPVICSIHPRTRSKLEQGGVNLKLHPLVQLHEPFGFFDFVKLEKHARCAITDSGTVQEECCILQVPTVTIRHTTERPETVDCGSNIVSGLLPERIISAVRAMISFPADWNPPSGYLAQNVSNKVVKFLLGGKWNV
ncbi:non-hydrolyzing UDP-N-acetylglucosamine 2-epimerase [Paenibacillus sp. GCM10012307]|uniref:UDP-N-acetylglucosamine 2-epimerase (Non-hydrolyzing) n=1 Tax=Paenibacillus roseus TaxID=2798579 RepID=A0A934J2Z4_9BACL|nr:UDP-N-acetylglucosamine 2-epimerase (non-hydrolyzing) [Paenibacillus roseus]MBJ6363811.1 UDP-N-acetylglucosamine 2-epimerase (non-hydrolyzing) [Paenibacillus roseus]